jgi:hypothetical protein
MLEEKFLVPSLGKAGPLSVSVQAAADVFIQSCSKCFGSVCNNGDVFS